LAKKIVDTNILLDYPDIIVNEENIVVPTTVISELESIKTSGTKSEEIRYKARHAVHMLEENPNKYEPYIVKPNEADHVIRDYGVDITNDTYIIYSCLAFEDSVLITNDLCMSLIAKNVFNVNVMPYNKDKKIYKGYKEVKLCDSELAYFYENMTENQFDNLINEYLIIDDIDGNIIDCYKWTENGYEKTTYRNIKTDAFGDIKPLDTYQECAFNSIKNNDITVLFGRSGAGKTTIPLYYLQSLYEKGKIRRIYIVYHYETLKGAKQLGYVKGDLTTKILETGSIGNILASKYGDKTQVQRLIEDGALEIIPTANIRGAEFGSDTGLLVTEAQNLDTYTLKTIIQRCKNGCKQIYEGDILEQNDLNTFYVGIERMVEVFKNNKEFGCVKLKYNYRSKLSELADLM